MAQKYKGAVCRKPGGSRMMKALLSALIRLLSALRRWHPAESGAFTASHIPIASYSRRYPGRSSARDLRQSLGWIARTAGQHHQDRRA
jgi:hypothetical protein